MIEFQSIGNRNNGTEDIFVFRIVCPNCRTCLANATCGSIDLSFQGNEDVLGDQDVKSMTPDGVGNSSRPVSQQKRIQRKSGCKNNLTQYTIENPPDSQLSDVMLHHVVLSEYIFLT